MRKRVLTGSSALLLGLHMASPMLVFAYNNGVRELEVGDYVLNYRFYQGDEGIPLVDIIDGDKQVSHIYNNGSSSGNMSLVLMDQEGKRLEVGNITIGARRGTITFDSLPYPRKGEDNKDYWKQEPVENTQTDLVSTWKSDNETISTRLTPYEGVGVLHEYSFTNNRNQAVQVIGRRTVDTDLETDYVPIYSLGPGKGLYIKSSGYRLDYQVDIDNGPDFYSGFAWKPNARDLIHDFFSELTDHSSVAEDEVVLSSSDTALGMQWATRTVAPGETIKFAYVVKISGNINANASFVSRGSGAPKPMDTMYLDTSAYGDSEFSGVNKGSLEFALPQGVTLASGEKAQVLSSDGGVLRELDTSGLVRGNKVSVSLRSSDLSNDGFRLRFPLVPDRSTGGKELSTIVHSSLTTNSLGSRATTTEARVRMANAVETQKDVTYETIPVETERRKNSALPEGEERVVQEGKPGREAITYEVTLTNGVETGREEVGREVVEPMAKHIIEVGSMVREVKEEAREEAIPFGHQVVENPEVFEGEERIIQEGAPGILEIIDEVTYENGVEVNRRKLSDSVKVEPVPEILEVGTLVEERREEITQETIPFEVKIVENSDMHLGTSQVVQSGVNGVLDIIEEVVYHNGHEVERTEVNRVVSKEPVTQIVEEGSLVEEIVEEVVEEPITFETEMVDNILMEQGESRVTQEGQDGVKAYTYSVTYHNGQEVNRTLMNEEVLQDAIPEIIEEGAMVREVLMEEKEEAIGYENETHENKDLPEGDKQMVQEGQPGVLKITEEVVIENGVEVSRREVDREVLQDAVNGIMEIGTGVFGHLEEVEEIELPYETEYVENEGVEEGREEVLQEGQVGIKTITSVYETFNDEKIGDPEVTEEVIREPVNEVIEVGTGVVGSTEEVEEVELPYDTQRVENKELEEGQEQVVQEGQAGIKTVTSVYETFNDEKIGDPEVIEEVTQEPVNEIIEVGTGVVGSTEEIEEVELPYDTQRVENKELEEGQEQVVQEGQAGIKTVTSIYETFNDEKVGDPEVTEEFTQEPVSEIIEVGVGVKAVDEETQDVAIPFDTKRVENPNLPEGETHLAQKGEVGIKRITTKQATFNEEAVGEPEVTEEVIKEPVDEIIEVGTYRRPVQGKVMPQPVVKQDLPSTGETLRVAGILAGFSSLIAGLGAWFARYRRK